MPVAEVTDVRELKRYLHRLHGFPPRFRQRLLLPCGRATDDSAKLDSSTDLELVLLNWSEASQMQAEELLTAAQNGSASDAPSLARGLSGFGFLEFRTWWRLWVFCPRASGLGRLGGLQYAL